MPKLPCASASRIPVEKLNYRWRHFQAMSLLGAVLTALGEHVEAERLLLAGFAKMQQPRGRDRYKTDALSRIVELYEAWDKRDEAARWRKKLDAVNSGSKKLDAKGKSPK